MHESEKKCIGIDVGGTSVKIGLFETDGTLLFKWEVPTRKEVGGRYILEDVAASIREVLMEKEIHLSDIPFNLSAISFSFVSMIPEITKTPSSAKN